MIENVGMRLFDFIKQNNLIRTTANGFGQDAAFLITDISRRRADQAGNRVFLHIFGHINAEHGAFVIEQELGQCLA